MQQGSPGTPQGRLTLAQTPKPGQVVSGTFFNEPMRVETVRRNGAGAWTLGLVGARSERFRSVTLTDAEIASLKLLDRACSYAGDGTLLRLGLQAYSLGIPAIASAWPSRMAAVAKPGPPIGSSNS